MSDVYCSHVTYSVDISNLNTVGFRVRRARYGSVASARQWCPSRRARRRENSHVSSGVGRAIDFTARLQCGLLTMGPAGAGTTARSKTRLLVPTHTLLDCGNTGVMYAI